MATVKQKEALRNFQFKARPQRTGYGYVYLIRCGDYYKIGYGYNLDQRLNSLQCGNPYELELIDACYTPKYRQLEEQLHKQYSDKRHVREWFLLEVEDIWEVSKKMVEWGGNALQT